MVEADGVGDAGSDGNVLVRVGAVREGVGEQAATAATARPRNAMRRRTVAVAFTASATAIDADAGLSNFVRVTSRTQRPMTAKKALNAGPVCDIPGLERAGRAGAYGMFSTAPLVTSETSKYVSVRQKLLGLKMIPPLSVTVSPSDETSTPCGS